MLGAKDDEKPAPCYLPALLFLQILSSTLPSSSHSLQCAWEHSQVCRGRKIKLSFSFLLQENLLEVSRVIWSSCLDVPLGVVEVSWSYAFFSFGVLQPIPASRKLILVEFCREAGSSLLQCSLNACSPVFQRRMKFLISAKWPVPAMSHW